MELGYAIPYDIHIRRSANKGFIVTIGCGDFVARSKAELLNELVNYIEYPEKWEREYNKNCSGSDEVAQGATETQPIAQPEDQDRPR